MRVLLVISLLLVAAVTVFSADDPVVVLAQKKEWAAVLAAVEKEPSLISKADEKNGNTVLLLAILNKDAAVVEGLLQRSKLKSLDGMKNKRELTPLHLAVLIGDSAIFDAVLKLTQNVNVLMGFDTPLCVAIPSGAKKEMIQALLDKGADPEIPNGLGQRPLHLALLGSQDEISKLLIEKGVNICVTALGVTPLELAVATGRKEICELLVSRDKTLVSLAGEEGDTPLHAAAALGDVELTQLLLKHGADSWAKNKKGRSAIDVAEEKWKKTKEQKFSRVLNPLERL